MECGDYNFSVKELADICAVLNLDIRVSFLQLHDSAQGNGHLPDDDMKETK